MTNLIRNAVVHGAGRGMINVVVSAGRLDVSDEGPGVPLELEPRLFDAFARGTGGTEGFGAACRTLLTWAVFGFLPFLVLSYLAFFLAARPLADLLARRQASLPAAVGFLPPAGYGVAIACGMFLLLRPGHWPGDLALLLCCLAAGTLNWFLYLRLAGPGPVSAD